MRKELSRKQMIVFNKYGLTGLKSVQNYRDSYSITEIWSQSAKEVFETKSAQETAVQKMLF